MKNFVRNIFVVLLCLCLATCSEEEVGRELAPDYNVGQLSFGSILSDIAKRNQLNKGSVSDSYEIPECSDDDPLFVRVAIKVKNENGQWSWYKNSNQNKIEIKVNPNGTDLDNDGDLDAWFTLESANLELEAGEYKITYFAVATRSGNNQADIIYMAPRIPEGEFDYNQSIQYHNFVDNPLPLQIKIRSGVIYYQPIEVLCYEAHYAFAFGYLFFNFNSSNLNYLCTYGNVCDDNEKHIPAQFKVKVWKDSNQGDLLVIAQNERKFFNDNNGTHYYADALCFPLPELGANDNFYAKIWLVENDKETLIREGSFNATDLAAIYREEQEHYYYHFREACCGAVDNFDLLADFAQNEENCKEEPQDPEVSSDCKVCEDQDDGKVSALSFKYTGQHTIKLTLKNKIQGEDIILIDDKTIASGEIIEIEGKWENPGHGDIIGNDLKFIINNQVDEYMQVSCSQILYLGKKSSIENSSKKRAQDADDANDEAQDGNFEITYIKTSKGGACPVPN